MIHEEMEGLIKLIIDSQTDRLVGAHMFGNGVTELIATTSLALFLEGTAWELGMNVYPHPTVSEVIAEAAHKIAGYAIHM